MLKSQLSAFGLAGLRDKYGQSVQESFVDKGIRNPSLARKTKIRVLEKPGCLLFVHTNAADTAIFCFLPPHARTPENHRGAALHVSPAKALTQKKHNAPLIIA
jgi:hypothetical protein